MKSVFSMLLVMVVCQTVRAQRPASLWVERVVTTERARQLYVALNQNLWILYDLPYGALYKAWQGGTTGGQLRMASYWFGGTAHFAHHYVTSGRVYFNQGVGEYFSSWTPANHIDQYYTRWPAQPRNFKAWLVTQNGQDVNATLKYQGYFIEGNEFRLNLSLILQNGTEIRITETPEYSNASNRTNLVRDIDISGIPGGHDVRLNLTGGTSQWQVSGQGSLQSQFMIQNSDGQTTVTGFWN